MSEESDKQALHLHLYQSIAGAMLGNPKGRLDEMEPQEAADVIYDYYSAILNRYYNKPKSKPKKPNKPVE